MLRGKQVFNNYTGKDSVFHWYTWRKADFNWYIGRIVISDLYARNIFLFNWCTEKTEVLKWYPGRRTGFSLVYWVKFSF